MHDMMDIELVKQWIAILGNRCCKDDDFVQLAYSFHELIHAWPFDDIDIVVLSLDLHRDGEICLIQNLKAAMHQGLVEIEYQTLPTF